MPEIERQRPLATVTTGELVDRPALLTATRLDLDHIGAEVGEALAGERAGDIRPEVQHPDAVEGLLAAPRGWPVLGPARLVSRFQHRRGSGSALRRAACGPHPPAD